MKMNDQFFSRVAILVAVLVLVLGSGSTVFAFAWPQLSAPDQEIAETLVKARVRVPIYWKQKTGFPGRELTCSVVIDEDSTIDDAGLEVARNLSVINHLYVKNPRITGTGLTAFAGEGRLRQLNIRVEKSNLSDDGWKAVSKLNGISELHVVAPLATAAQYNHLQGITSVESVVLDNLTGNVDDFLAGWLPKCQKLKSFSIGSDDFTGKAFQQLPPMPLLEKVSIRGKNVTDEVFSSLSRFENLRSLEIAFGSGKEKVLLRNAESLEKLTHLESLSLHPCEFEDDTIEQIAKLTSLDRLYLTESLLKDSHFEALAKLPKLTKLSLQKSHFEGARLDALAVIPKLEELDLTESKINFKNLALLKKLSGLRKLGLGRCHVEDSDLDALNGIQSKLQIEASRTHISYSRAAKFTADNPTVALMVGSGSESLSIRTFVKGKWALTPGGRDTLELGTKDGK